MPPKRGGTEESGKSPHADQVLNYLGDREETQGKRSLFSYILAFRIARGTRDVRPNFLEKYGATNHTDQNSLLLATPENSPKLTENYLKRTSFS